MAKDTKQAAAAGATGAASAAAKAAEAKKAVSDCVASCLRRRLGRRRSGAGSECTRKLWDRERSRTEPVLLGSQARCTHGNYTMACGGDGQQQAGAARAPRAVLTPCTPLAAAPAAQRARQVATPQLLPSSCSARAVLVVLPPCRWLRERTQSKKATENINSKLALVMKSGKYSLGYKTALKTLRSGKGEGAFSRLPHVRPHD